MVRLYVLVELVKLLGSEVNNTIHHPSALGVDVSSVMPGNLKSDHLFLSFFCCNFNNF